jgi:rhodanese-related sulfurtransferase
MNGFGQLAGIMVISGTAAVATFWVKGPPRRTYFCNPATLKADEVCLSQVAADSAILWVDARHRSDWEKSHMPGAVLWNLDASEDMQAFEANLAAHLMETPRVIVYCSDENCGLSREVAKRINDLALGAKVSVLRGGWRALVDGQKIKDSNPKD